MHISMPFSHPIFPCNFPLSSRQKYNEFVLCLKLNGPESVCAKAKNLAQSICPMELVNQWDEQRENGNFLGVQEREPVQEEHH